MANRNWASGGKMYSMLVKPTIINCGITVGATGAVASFVGSTILSVVRNGTGLYTITLQPNTNFPNLVFGQGSMRSPVSGLSGITQIEIQNNPAVPLAVNSSTAGGSIQIKTLSASGALADAASGSLINVLLLCNDSSVPG